MKGLILAGGKGTRLRPITYAMAKQLVPVANRPILHYAIDALYAAGIRSVGVIISPETGEAVKHSLTQWQQMQAEPVELVFIMQDAPSGLAHAVKIAQDYLKDSRFLMYLGDNLIDGDLGAMCRAFEAQPQLAASILLKPVDNPSSFGVAQLDENGQVLQLVEKPKNPPSNLALVGVYLFTAKIFEAIANIAPSPRGELEITDAIQWLVTHAHPVASQVHHGWWLDTGKKDDLLSANCTVLETYAKAAQSAKTIQVDAHSQLIGEVELGEGVVLEHCHITGPVRIGARCRLSHCVIEPYTSIGSGSMLEHVAIGNSVVLEHCTIAHIPGAISNSLIGQNCVLTHNPTAPVPPQHQFLLCDDSEVLVG